MNKYATKIATEISKGRSEHKLGDQTGQENKPITI